MKRLDEIIDFYLKNDTNYALLITGEWGVGKTFYYKNILEKQISLTPVINNNKKKYKPVLLSLFGLKSIEEIQTGIFLSLFPILKNKAVKLGVGVGKSLIKGILSLKNLGNYFDFVSDIDIDKQDWLKFEDLVICFDDLERASESLRIEELIGYVNSLVENENVKIIIIANENKIQEPKYKLLKEKVIGNSIEFIPDLSYIFDSLTHTKFSSYNTYTAYLQENKDKILDIFIKKTSNLRILSYALTCFQSIYSETLTELPNVKGLDQKLSEILLQLIKFTLIISIEYKESRLSYSKRQDLDLHQGLDLMKLSVSDNLSKLAQSAEKIEIMKSYRELFLEDYYKGDTFYFFKSIYCFITGGAKFKIEELIVELKSFYHVERGQILPQYSIIERLKYPFNNSLSDREYKSLTREMLVYCDKGRYELTYYLTVFMFASRFGNPLSYNLNKLEIRIIKGMGKGFDKYKYDDRLQYYLGISHEEEFKESLKRIQSAILSPLRKVVL